MLGLESEESAAKGGHLSPSCFCLQDPSIHAEVVAIHTVIVKPGNRKWDDGSVWIIRSSGAAW